MEASGLSPDSRCFNMPNSSVLNGDKLLPEMSSTSLLPSSYLGHIQSCLSQMYGRIGKDSCRLNESSVDSYLIFMENLKIQCPTMAASIIWRQYIHFNISFIINCSDTMEITMIQWTTNILHVSEYALFFIINCCHFTFFFCRQHSLFLLCVCKDKEIVAPPRRLNH